MAAGNFKLQPIPSIIHTARQDLAKLNEDCSRFSIDAINRFKSIQLQVADLQGQLDALSAEFDLSNVLTAPPIGIGGGNLAGTLAAHARADHNHAIRETSGPQDLTMGNIFALDVVSRVGNTLAGKTILGQRTTGTPTNNTTTLANFVSHTIPKAGEFLFVCVGTYNTAVATTAINFAGDYTGTAPTFAMRGSIQATTTTFEGITVTALATKVQVASGAGYPAATGNGLFVLFGTIVTTTAGTFSLQFCSEVAASAVVINGAVPLFVMERS